MNSSSSSEQSSVREDEELISDRENYSISDDLNGFSIAGESYSDQIDNLSRNFKILIEKMTKRVQFLSQSAHESVITTHKQLEATELARADVQIARVTRILKQCDELEDEFLKIKQIGEIAKGFKERIISLEKELEAL